jgi:hypothetical protein
VRPACVGTQSFARRPSPARAILCLVDLPVTPLASNLMRKIALALSLVLLFALGSCSSFSTTGYRTDRAFKNVGDGIANHVHSIWIDFGHINATLSRHFLNYRPNRF